MDSRERIESAALVWVVVGIIGVFAGISWLTGPIVWSFAIRLRRRAEALDLETPDRVRAARIVGIATTILAVCRVVYFFHLAGVAMNRL